MGDDNSSGRATIRDVIELLKPMNDKLDAILQKEPAFEVRLSAVEGRLDAHGTKIGELADKQRTDEEVSNALAQSAKSHSQRRDWWATAAMFTAPTVISLLAFLGIHVH